MDPVNELFKKAFQSISMIGQVLIDDDAHDFGWFTYYDRQGHKDHPSPFHHWQIGMIMVAIGEVMQRMTNLLDALGQRVDVVFNSIRQFLTTFARPSLPYGKPPIKQLPNHTFEQLLGDMYYRRER